MADGAHDAATLRRYSEAQARLEHAGGWGWRDRAASVLRGLGFRDADLDRQLATFSGGELTRASLARALAGRSRPAAPRRAHEPPRRREPRMAGAGADHDRRSSVLVAHDRWFLESVTTAVLELEGGRALTFFPGRGISRRLERAARAQAAAKSVQRVGRRHRAPGAVRGAVPVQEVEGEAGSGKAHADRASSRSAAGGRRAREPRGAAHARLRVPQAGAHGPDRGRRRGLRPARRATSSCSKAARS